MESSKKLNIAITGTFDVENYGDLLFPTVFEKAMKKRGLNFNLFLFSPSISAPKALDDSQTVYSYRDFDALHKKHPFDALVVGGGAIIHFFNIDVKLPGSKNFSSYRNIDSWLTPMYMASKNKVKILFNVPQAPFEFSQSIKALAKAAIDQVSYLTVRDEFSKSFIKDLYGDEKLDIKVYPDSICSISEYYDKEELKTRAEELLGFKDEYVAVHFSRVMPEEAIPDLVKALTKLRNAGYKIVLLPLGYTHGDDVAMSAFKKSHFPDCFTFKKKLSIDDMTAILASCYLYIGTSFHGSIVSMSFGNRAISFNYYDPTLKNVDNYRMFGVNDYLAKTFQDLNPIVDKILDEKTNYKNLRAQVSKKTAEHFNNLCDAIIHKKECTNFDELNTTMLNVIANSADLDGELMNAKRQLETTKQQLFSTQQALNNYKTNYNRIINSKYWKMLKPARTIRKIIKNNHS